MTSYLCIGVWRESSGCNSLGLFLFLHILLVCLLLRLTYLTPVIVRLVLVKHDIAHPVIRINAQQRKEEPQHRERQTNLTQQIEGQGRVVPDMQTKH